MLRPQVQVASHSPLMSTTCLVSPDTFSGPLPATIAAARAIASVDIVSPLVGPRLPADQCSRAGCPDARRFGRPFMPACRLQGLVRVLGSAEAKSAPAG